MAEDLARRGGRAVAVGDRPAIDHQFFMGGKVGRIMVAADECECDAAVAQPEFQSAMVLLCAVAGGGGLIDIARDDEFAHGELIEERSEPGLGFRQGMAGQDIAGHGACPLVPEVQVRDHGESAIGIPGSARAREGPGRAKDWQQVGIGGVSGGFPAGGGGIAPGRDGVLGRGGCEAHP